MRALTARGRAGWVLLAILLSVIYGLPAIYLFWHGVALIAIATESLGYRYFNSLRILEGERGFLFIPQGHTLVIFQHLINLGLTHIGQVPLSDLRTRLNVFGYATLFLNAAAMGLVLVLALGSARLLWADKLLLATLAISPVYFARGTLTNAITPDYYVAEVTLTALAFWIFLRQLRSSEANGRRTAFLGSVAGAMAGMKLTLVLMGALTLWPSIARHPGPVSNTARKIILAGAFASAAFSAIVLGVYLFDLNAFAQFLQRQAAFVRTAGSEPAFWTTLVSPSSPDANSAADYRYAWIIIPLWIMVLLAVGIWEARGNLQKSFTVGLVLLIAVMGAAHIVSLVMRPAGSTLYELSLFAVGSAAASISAMSDQTARKVLALVFSVIVGGQAAIAGSANFALMLPVDAFKESGKRVWEIHDFLRARRRPVLVYIPNNAYSGGTVEEALMKGMSDFPTWKITTGKALLDRLAPHLSFHQTLEDVPAGSVVFWLDIPGEASLVEQTTALRRAVSRPDVQCRRWELNTAPTWRHIAHACSVD